MMIFLAFLAGWTLASILFLCGEIRHAEVIYDKTSF